MPRIKVSSTIDPELIAQLDRMIKNRVFRSRSHGVEVALAEMLERRKKGH